MLRRFLLSLLVLAGVLPARAQTTVPYLQQAFQGVNALQTFYTPDTGLYKTTGWWNAGNSITVLANYSRLDGTDAYYPIFANTLKQAPTVNPGFIDGFYDDDGWWALAWIDVYDLTKQPQYLQQAESIFQTMTGAWDGTCGGGIWWNTDRQYKNAIANELFLSVAAELAARASNAPAVGIGTGTPPRTYLQWAKDEWTWFHGSGMINGENLINDGLDTATCKNNGQTQWSYNQGVILGGLVQLSALDGDTTLVPQAQAIATAAMAQSTEPNRVYTDANGVLHDPCEPNCGSDGVEFKGVFSRNLMALQAAAPDPRYKTFADANAQSIYTKAQGPGSQFGQVWSGPFDAANAASQNSALDAILLAAASDTIAAGGSGGGAVPSFTLRAAPEALNLTAGAQGSTTLTLTPSNGFSGTVALTTTVVGAPAGVQAALGSQTLTGTGQTSLQISTTGATPGGNFLVAVTGVSGGLAQTAYVTVQLPDFAVASASKALYVNQVGDARDALTISPVDGFNGQVQFAAAGLPDGVKGLFAPPVSANATTLDVLAGPLAETTSGVPVTVTGTSGPTTHTVSGLTLAVSAALGNCGQGVAVNLGPQFNLTALRSDGTTYTDGGADGQGFSYSAELVGGGRVLNGTRFVVGPADAADAVYANGQTITLPAGRFTTLHLLGSGVGGTQAAQGLTVTYADGSTAALAQSFTDWYGTPTPNANEGEAVAMPYRNQSDGTKQQVQFNLYGYSLALDPTKTVKSLTLPKNRSVLLLSATLSVDAFGREADLSSAFNAAGLYADGVGFQANGGVDGGGFAYSANVLGDIAAAGGEVTVGTTRFHLGAANRPNVVYGAGQTIALPFGPFLSLSLLGTAVGGNQTDQPLVLHYADGSSETRSVSFSDWFSPGGFAGETTAIKTPYRNQSNGTPQAVPFNIYRYNLALNPLKPVRSITLPINRSVVLLGITLGPYTQYALQPVLCTPR